MRIRPCWYNWLTLFATTLKRFVSCDWTLNRSGASAARGHSACIWIGKRDLRVWIFVKLRLDVLEFLHLLFERFYLFFQPLCFGLGHFWRCRIRRIHRR